MDKHIINLVSQNASYSESQGSMMTCNAVIIIFKLPQLKKLHG